MRRVVVALCCLLFPFAVRAATLPGFAVEQIAPTNGFLTSIVVDSRNRIHYSTTDGSIFRLDGTTSVRVAAVETAAEGNAALLGVAMFDDDRMVAHYVAPDLMSDLVSIVDLRDGTVTEVAKFVCDEGRVCSSEHHGGNPIVVDGTIYVALGDFGGGPRAQHPTNPGGKIFRFKPGEEPQPFAIGVRNPYDFAFDRATGTLIVPDNGPVGGDEVNRFAAGANGGWPYTWGNEAPVAGMVAPLYVWTDTIAPTGTMLASGRGALPARSLLVASFVTRALYLFPSIDGDKLADPIALTTRETPMIIDVVEDREGQVIFGSPQGIYRLRFPIRGDVDGNGEIDARDNDALAREIVDGDDNALWSLHEGTYAATWGADVNGDRVIDTRDLVALARLRAGKQRVVRRP